MVSVFASSDFGGLGYAQGMNLGKQLQVQVIGIVATVAWSVILTYIILKLVAGISGLRVSTDRENEGLDITSHGERGYNL